MSEPISGEGAVGAAGAQSQGPCREIAIPKIPVPLGEWCVVNRQLGFAIGVLNGLQWTATPADRKRIEDALKRIKEMKP